MEKTKYTGKFIRVTEEVIEGHTWERAYFNDGILVFAVNSENKLLMIEEVRPHEAQKIRHKFVTGNLEIGEEPTETANRELQEEAGFKANKLTKLLEIKSSGTLNNSFHMYLAQDLVPSKIPNPDGENSIVSISYHSLDEILKLLEKGLMGWSIATLGIFKLQNLRETGQLSL